MKKLAFAAAALGALAFTVPAFAQDVKVKIGEGHHHHWRGHEVRMHRDHGWHEGRHHHHHGKVVIIKKGHGKTIIKKHEG